MRDFLSKVVCLQVKDGEHRLHEKFGVQGYPTLVLLHPDGKVLFNEGGAPQAQHFLLWLGQGHAKTMITAYNAQDWQECARATHLLRTYFPGTPSGKRAEEIFRASGKILAFNRAYREAAQADEARRAAAKKRLADARLALLRAAAKRLRDAADEKYKRGKRHAAFRIYREIILEYPKTPEADHARKRLKKHYKKWTEPDAG